MKAKTLKEVERATRSSPGQWLVRGITDPGLLPQAAIARFDGLAKLKLGVKKNDLRIAAIALEVGGIIVTRNLRDFQRVPGLNCEDWTV